MDATSRKWRAATFEGADEVVDFGECFRNAFRNASSLIGGSAGEHRRPEHALCGRNGAESRKFRAGVRKSQYVLEGNSIGNYFGTGRYIQVRDPQCDSVTTLQTLRDNCTLNAVADAKTGQVVLRNPLPGARGMSMNTAEAPGSDKLFPYADSTEKSRDFPPGSDRRRFGRRHR